MTTRPDRDQTVPEPDLAPPLRAPAAFDLAFLTIPLPDLTHLYLVRHAQQAVDRDGPVGGLVDPPLSALGLRQAAAAGAALAGAKLDAVYCSDLQRARSTAEAIAAQHGLTPRVVGDLREVDVWRDMPQGETLSEFVGEHYLAALRDRMVAEKNWDVYPYCEPSAFFKRRVINAHEAIVASHPGQRVAVVSHGGSINAYTGHIIGSRYDMFFRQAHAAISLALAAQGRRALRSLNDTHHLVGELETY